MVTYRTIGGIPERTSFLGAGSVPTQPGSYGGGYGGGGNIRGAMYSPGGDYSGYTDRQKIS